MQAPAVSATSGDIAAQSMCGPFGAAARRSWRHLRVAPAAAPPACATGATTRLTARSASFSATCGYSAKRDDRQHERHEHEPVAAATSRTTSTRRPGAVVHRADVEPQRVDRREHDADRGDDRERELGR